MRGSPHKPFLFTFAYLLLTQCAAGNLASRYAIQEPSLVHRLEDENKGNLVTLKYVLSSEIEEEQIYVQLYEYKCEELLSQQDGTGFRVGKIQKHSDGSQVEDGKQAWILPLAVQSPSTWTKIRLATGNFQDAVFDVMKTKQFRDLASRTSLFYDNIVGIVSETLQGDSDSIHTAVCVRLMLHTMDHMSPHAIEVNFDRTQLKVFLEKDSDGIFKISHVEKKAKEKVSITVDLGGAQASTAQAEEEGGLLPDSGIEEVEIARKSNNFNGGSSQKNDVAYVEHSVVDVDQPDNQSQLRKEEAGSSANAQHCISHIDESTERCEYPIEYKKVEDREL